LRATQFHDGFILLMVKAMSKLPLIPLPSSVRFQPIDADEVADVLVELALAPPAGQAPDIAGPKIYDAEHLLRTYLNAVGKRRAIIRIGTPGAAAAAVRARRQPGAGSRGRQEDLGGVSGWLQAVGRPTPACWVDGDVWPR